MVQLNSRVETIKTAYKNLHFPKLACDGFLFIFKIANDSKLYM